MKRIFTLAMLMLAFDAHAQQVYKCVDRSGNVAYQSDPCSQTQTTARTWEAMPDPVPDGSGPASVMAPVSKPRSAAAYPRSSASRWKGRGTIGAAIPVENGGNSRSCEAAKASRTQTLERVGLKRTFELLRKLDDAVHRACK